MNRFCYSRFGLYFSMLMLLFLVCLSPGQTAPRLANTSAWQLTPYERNPFLFGNEQTAIQALDNPDILMRRSGVEWLGRWTAMDGWSHRTVNGADYELGNRLLLHTQQAIVPKLTRAVREMPDADSLQAARLLAVLGTSARSAIPAICAELASPDYGDGKPADGDDFVARADLLNTLNHLCGGPRNLAPILTVLLHDREPETRRAAAAAIRFCDDALFRHISPPPEGAYVHYASSEEDNQWHIEFRRQIIPALAKRVDDPVTVVRLAALESLEALTYNSAEAPWNLTLAPLSRAVASTDPTLRLAALRVLAYMPTDVSPLASALRGEMHDGSEEQTYALAALCHAAQTDRVGTADVFLADMTSPNLTQRRQAAADMRLMVMPLWDGGFFPDREPLNWFNDDRLFATTPSSLPGLSPSQRDMEQKRWQAAETEVQPRLLAALVKAASDPDHSVRTDAASSLELIGQWAAAASSHGFYYESKATPGLTVKEALAQSADALGTPEPALANRLRELNGGIFSWQSPLIKAIQDRIKQ